MDKQTESRFTVKMVFCIGCGSQSTRDKHLHFARVPSVVNKPRRRSGKIVIVDWLPTLNLNLKIWNKYEERECKLAEVIAAKKLRLNEAGEQVSDISFAEELPKYVDSSTKTEEFDYLVAAVPPQRPFCEEEFCNDDKRVKFYTGLPSLDTLKVIFLRIVPFVTRKPQHLTPFQDLICLWKILPTDLMSRFLLGQEHFRRG